MILAYEQFGIILNLGVGNWTAIRKVNATSAEDPQVTQYCISVDYFNPGHAIPYPNEAERDSHWEKIVSVLRQQLNATGIVGATRLPPNIMNPAVERR